MPREPWRDVAAIGRVLGDPPLTNPVQRFSGALATWQDPRFVAPLHHAVGAGEPSGVIGAAPVPSVSADPAAPGLPLAAPAPDVRRLWTAPTRWIGAVVQRMAGPQGAATPVAPPPATAPQPPWTPAAEPSPEPPAAAPVGTAFAQRAPTFSAPAAPPPGAPSDAPVVQTASAPVPQAFEPAAPTVSRQTEPEAVVAVSAVPDVRATASGPPLEVPVPGVPTAEVNAAERPERSGTPPAQGVEATVLPATANRPQVQRSSVAAPGSSAQRSSVAAPGSPAQRSSVAAPGSSAQRSSVAAPDSSAQHSSGSPAVQRLPDPLAAVPQPPARPAPADDPQRHAEPGGAVPWSAVPGSATAGSATAGNPALGAPTFGTSDTTGPVATRRLGLGAPIAAGAGAPDLVQREVGSLTAGTPIVPGLAAPTVPGGDPTDAVRPQPVQRDTGAPWFADSPRSPVAPTAARDSSPSDGGEPGATSVDLGALPAEPAVSDPGTGPDAAAELPVVRVTRPDPFPPPAALAPLIGDRPVAAVSRLVETGAPPAAGLATAPDKPVTGAATGGGTPEPRSAAPRWGPAGAVADLQRLPTPASSGVDPVRAEPAGAGPGWLPGHPHSASARPATGPTSGVPQLAVAPALPLTVARAVTAGADRTPTGPQIMTVQRDGPAPGEATAAARPPAGPAVPTPPAGATAVLAPPADAATVTAPPAVAAPPAASAIEPETLLATLYDPLLRRLKAELRIDRDRRGWLTDLPR
ncbi:hypothetical protein ACFOHP_25810 [Couchioplanes caeruleus subsp. azureus]|uniref:hypothetical protein n=1 Tax=Couchioplanes caeruleus TaxID=56438 RepID=UPI00360B0F46